MTKFFKPQVNSRFITNINNINYTNNKINYTNFKICEITNGEEIPPAGASGLASLSRPSDSPGVSQRGVLVDPAEILPDLWRGLKIDIFDNAPKGSDKQSLKIKFGIIRKDSTTQSILANLNSPNSYLWRRVSDVEWNNFHWTTVRNIQDHFEENNMEYRCSKCVLPNNSNTTEMVAFLTQDPHTYAIILVREGQQYNFFIDKSSSITSTQRIGNIIASKYIGQSAKPLLTCKELGI